MFLINKLEKFIFESPLWLFCLCLFLLIFFKIGFWYIPNLELSHQISLDPFRNPFEDPNAHYLMSTWLSPFLAWVFGIKTWFKFFLLHLFFCLVFSLVYVLTVTKRFQGEQARVSLICLIILPVSGTIFYWIGPDALTILLILLIFCFGKYLFICFSLSVLLGFQHFEQGVLGASALLLGILINNRFALKNSYTTKFYTLFFLGIITGKIFQTILFNYLEFNLNSGRAFWLQNHYISLMNQFIFNFQFILWSTIGLGWLLVIQYIEITKKYWGFLVSLLTLLFLLPIVQDQTRVLSIMLFPLFLNYCLFNSDFLKSVSRTQCASLFLLWLIIPWGWVFSGNIQVSVFPYTVMNLSNKFLGWFSVPSNHDYWPFR